MHHSTTNSATEIAAAWKVRVAKLELAVLSLLRPCEHLLLTLCFDTNHFAGIQISTLSTKTC